MSRKRFSSSSFPTSSGGSQRNDSESESYWSKLFTGTDYEDLYKSIMLKYNTAPPNTFWGALTGQNKTNAYNHQMAMQDELGALAEKMYNEDYQSPFSEAERLRSAGMNPDLLGLSDAVSPEMNPNGVPNGTAANGLGVVQGAAGILLNAFTLGKGIADGVLNFKSMKLDNVVKGLSLATDIGGFIPPQSALDSEASSQYSEIDMLTSSLFNKRDSRKMSHLLKQVVNHPRFKAGYYGNLKSYSSDRQEYFFNTSGQHWNDDDKVMHVLSRGLSDIVNLAFKSDKERSISDNAEAIEFNEVFDSSGSATAENSVNELQGFKKDVTKSLLDTVADLNKLDSDLARGIQIALQVLLAKYIGI